MTETPHCDRFLRNTNKPTLTPDDRKKVHHLLHALAVNYQEVPVSLRHAVESMRKLEADGRLTWSNLLNSAAPNAAQVVWTIGHAADMLWMYPTPTADKQSRFTVPDYADLITALDDTVTLWRHGRLVEGTMDPDRPQEGPDSLNGLACDGTHRLLDALGTDYADVWVPLAAAVDLMYRVDSSGPFTWRAYLAADGESLAALAVFNIGRRTETIRVHEGCLGADNTYFVPDFTALRDAVDRRLAAWRKVVTTKDAEATEPPESDPDLAAVGAKFDSPIKMVQALHHEASPILEYANTGFYVSSAPPAAAHARRATVMLAPLNASTDLNRLTEAEVRDIVNEFLGTQGMAGYEFTLHDITDNSARFSGPRGGSRNLPVWSGMVKWRNVIRVWGRAVVDYDAEFDKPAAPTEPVPDLTATDLGPFYAAKVKAEAAKPARHPMTRLQIAIADYEAARYAQLHSITTHPDAPTRDALERAVIAAARDVCREAVDE